MYKLPSSSEGNIARHFCTHPTQRRRNMLWKKKQSSTQVARDDEAQAFDEANSHADEQGHETDRRGRNGEARKSALTTYLAGIINPPAPAPGLIYAGFWRRYAAFMIDFPLSLVAALALNMLVQSILPRSWFMGGLIPLSIILFGQIAYFVVFESSRWKATPGKRFFKLRVIDKVGKQITWKRSLVRAIIGLPSIPLIMGVLMIGFNRKRQSFADRVTKTLVVKKASESFLPAVLRPFELINVVIIAAVLTFLVMESCARIAQPVVDRLTIRMMTEASLKLMAPAQISVETLVSQNKRLPADLDKSVIGYSRKGFAHTIAYNPASGAITLWFMDKDMQGKGLSLLPTLNQGSGKITWKCAGVNLEDDITPGRCATAKR